MHNTNGVLTDEQMAEMQRRNEERVARVIAEMGVSYACHPKNSVTKNPDAANFQPAKEIDPVRLPALRKVKVVG